MRWILVLFLFLITACVPVSHKYYYISLEDRSNLRVLKSAKSGIDNLKNHKKMPVSYELVNDLYTVYFDLDTMSKRSPRAFIRVKNHEGTSYEIQGLVLSDVDPLKRCSVFSDPYPHDNFPASEKVQVYDWYLFREGCSVDKDTSKKSLSFEIFDENDVLIGTEELFFYLIKNGSYIVYDSI